MKHAGGETLAGLAPVLARLRALKGLMEKKPGIFYVKGQAFLHFHEDPAGIFVDLKFATGWRRLKGTRALMAAASRALKSLSR